MKASEVLSRYASGERDFRRVSLRGQSFQGKDLSRADFSEADLRGANFQQATLSKTKFCKAKAGLQKRWAIALVIVSCLLSGLSSCLSGFVGYLVLLIFESRIPTNVISGVVTLIVLGVLFFVTIYQGLGAGLAVVALAGAVAVTVALAGSFAGAGSGVFAGAGPGAVAVTVALVAAITVAVAVAVAVLITGSVTDAVPIVASAIAGVVVVASAIAGVVVAAHFFDGPVVVAIPVPIAFLVALLGAYMSWHSLVRDEKHSWIPSIAITFAATGGTSFYNADLTDADFTGATLKSTDLRKANLTRTCWRDTIKLDRARPGKTILANAAVRELLVSGYGYKKSYVDANLRGANLTGAHLNYANLKLADISEATFEEANLEWANLTETNCIGTDFTHAYFTGASLEAWNIESSTNLEQVDCQFVYLLENPEPGTDNRERRPSSGEFQAGEFTKLFQEVLDTVDLIFQDGVNWEAFIKAFDKVREKVRVESEGTELTVQSIENKGDNVFVIKVNVPPDADKEKIHSDFTQNYEIFLKAIEEKYRLQLNAKDSEIAIYRQQSADFMEITKILASRPMTEINTGNITGGIIAGGNASGVAGKNQTGVAGGDISGTVTATINQLPDSPNQPGIKELLAELQAAIADETNLDDDDKAEALEQVGTLAEAGKNPEDGVMKKAAKTATLALKGIAANLPAATKFIEACNNLLPEIARLLGLG